MSKDLNSTRELLVDLHTQLKDAELVVWSGGNISQRVDGGFLIKPSGLLYGQLTAESMVLCDLDGNVLEGKHAPSSDTASHAYIYRNMPEVNGVVHTHSNYASAWAAVQPGVSGRADSSITNPQPEAAARRGRSLARPSDTSIMAVGLK